MVEPQHENTDNSGMGVILGILVAVLLVVGGFFFLQSQGMIGGTTDTTTVNVETPAPTAAEPAAGTPAPQSTEPVAP